LPEPLYLGLLHFAEDFIRVGQLIGAHLGLH
jgi:hypothetical protein